MPNLPAHIDLAYQAAQRLRHQVLEANMGYFLLGATSPDIRVITRGRREEYHFAPLDFKALGTGVQGLFSAHPHLLPASSQEEPARAFIAGYITHLIADETWIVDMFRPYFGNTAVFEDLDLGNVMDRALQLELDRQGWQTIEATRPLLASATNGINIGFIPSETLAQWRQWVLSFLDRGFTWDRLRFMARRIAAGNDGHPAHRLAEEFLKGMPQSLARIYQYVPPDSLQEFKERTIHAFVQKVEEYLT